MKGRWRYFHSFLDDEMPARTIDLILASLAPLGPFATHLFFPVVRIVACVHALASAALSISCIARIE
jgi:hypothetical protein